MTNPAADQFYQVSFEVENVGKTVEKTKKRITWVFGKHGDDNKEYTVTLVWSKMSGKRFVYMANEQIHFEEKKTATFFYKWKVEDDMELHIIATAATPSKKAVGPHFIKYELLINGNRFIDLPRKDGTKVVEDESSDTPTTAPGSILDIMYPHGYHKSMKKTEASFSSRASMTREVNRRVLEQANAQLHAQKT